MATASTYNIYKHNSHLRGNGLRPARPAVYDLESLQTTDDLLVCPVHSCLWICQPCRSAHCHTTAASIAVFANSSKCMSLVFLAAAAHPEYSMHTLISCNLAHCLLSTIRAVITSTNSNMHVTLVELTIISLSVFSESQQHHNEHQRPAGC